MASWNAPCLPLADDPLTETTLCNQHHWISPGLFCCQTLSSLHLQKLHSASCNLCCKETHISTRCEQESFHSSNQNKKQIIILITEGENSNSKGKKKTQTGCKTRHSGAISTRTICEYLWRLSKKSNSYVETIAYIKWIYGKGVSKQNKSKGQLTRKKICSLKHKLVSEIWSLWWVCKHIK